MDISLLLYRWIFPCCCIEIVLDMMIMMEMQPVDSTILLLPFLLLLCSLLLFFIIIIINNRAIDTTSNVLDTCDNPCRCCIMPIKFFHSPARYNIVGVMQCMYNQIFSIKIFLFQTLCLYSHLIYATKLYHH
jgi:hypothetical protein